MGKEEEYKRKKGNREEGGNMMINERRRQRRINDSFKESSRAGKPNHHVVVSPIDEWRLMLPEVQL